MVLRQVAAWTGLMGVLVCSAGCRKEAPAPASEPATPPAPLVFEMAGCGAVRVEPADASPSPGPESISPPPLTCVLSEDRTIRLVVRGPLPVIAVDEQLVEARLESVVSEDPDEPAHRLTVVVPGGAKVLTLMRDGEPGERGAVRLADPAVDPELDRVSSLRRTDPAAALAALPDLETLTGPRQARALSLTARIALAQGRLDDAEAAFRRAMARHRALGQVSEEVLDGMALSWLLRSARRFDAARAALDGLEPALARSDDGRASVGYYRAQLARDVGNLRRAFALCNQVERACERLGEVRYRDLARQMTAELLLAVGRTDEALARYEALAPGIPARSCERADWLTGRGWAQLVIAMNRSSVSVGPGAQQVAPDPEAAFREAVELYRTVCPQPYISLDNARINLALAALVVGDPSFERGRAERARQALDALSADLSEKLRPWAALARARWFATTEAPLAEKARRFEEVARRGQAAALDEIAWRALIDRAALLRHSQPGEALEALEQAAAIAVQQARAIPLGQGRSAFSTERDQGTRLQVGLLLDMARPLDAIAVARAARRQALGAIRRLDRVQALDDGQRARWEAAVGRYRALRAELDRAAGALWSVPADELAAHEAALGATRRKLADALDEAFLALDGTAMAAPARPGPGEILFVAYPIADGRVAIMVQGMPGTAQQAGSGSSEPVVAIARLAMPEAAWPDGTLAPLDEVLGQLGSDAAGDSAPRVRVMVHGGLASLDVHSLPFRGGLLMDHAEVVYASDLGPAPSPVGRGVLLVADPTGDLPGARTEAARVLPLLRPERTLMGADATSRALREALPTVALLHYAGHGDGGNGLGWDSALRLAGDSQLDPADILTVSRVPEAVVLSGCETGQSGDGAAVGVSLAAAFLAAGSQSVIATTREVEDDVARTFAAALYEEAGAGKTRRPDYPRALRETRRQHPNQDWAAWRLMVR